MKDYLVRGVVSSQNCRVFAVRTTNLTNVAQKNQNLWPTASAAIGRVFAVTLMLGAMNKNKEQITVTVNGGGPIGTIMAVTDSDGHIKGFVSNPEVHYTYNDTGHLAVGLAVGKEGTLQVTRDMGLKEPFHGSVPLQTGEIGDDFSYYFMVSEQVPSAVSVGVLVDKDNSVLAAGGFIIQILPEATEANISYIEDKLKAFPSASTLIREGNSPEDILKKLFPDVNILEKKEVSFKCDCSRDRMLEAVKAVGKEQLLDMIKQDHGAEITCHFCNSRYHFAEADLQSLIDNNEDDYGK